MAGTQDNRALFIMPVSYQYLWITDDGTSHPLPSEGSFYETENRYQAMAYFKGTGDRTWRLTSYAQITLR